MEPRFLLRPGGKVSHREGLSQQESLGRDHGSQGEVAERQEGKTVRTSRPKPPVRAVLP